MSGRRFDVRVLIKSSGLPCTKGGDGAMGAYIFTIEGINNAQADFGSISHILLGFGRCSSTVNGSRDYVRNVVDEAKNALLDKLKSF
jgi:hypothetical protein